MSDSVGANDKPFTNNDFWSYSTVFDKLMAF